MRMLAHAEAEAWFVNALEDWRAAQGLRTFVLLGHSFGAYVASRYALQHPERVDHLILVGPAGFAPESHRMKEFRASWLGSLLSAIWQSGLTPLSLVRLCTISKFLTLVSQQQPALLLLALLREQQQQHSCVPCAITAPRSVGLQTSMLGWWGPGVVQAYTRSRFGDGARGLRLSPAEAPLFTDYLYHCLASRPSGELCLRHVFSPGGFARSPLCHDLKKWRVPTTFIYGSADLMDVEAGRIAARLMPVPAQVFTIPQGGHFCFMDNAAAFHAAVLQGCKEVLPASSSQEPMDMPLGGPVPVALHDEVGAEAEAWFVNALEDWRAAQGLRTFVLLGHSFGAYVASRYALQAYTRSRFGDGARGLRLSPAEAPLFTDYLYHCLASRPSGELCLRHVFSPGGFARSPLCHDLKKWRVPTTFIYGSADLMDVEAGRIAARLMPVPAQVFTIPQGGHFCFMDNAAAFHAAVLQGCKEVLPASSSQEPMDMPLGGPVPVALHDEVGAGTAEVGGKSSLSEAEVAFAEFSQTWRLG
eukprot:jgi/Mesen1/3862/ME000207S02883